MNKRKKNKLYKNTLIKIKKLHPQKSDVIFMMPDFDKIDFDVAFEYFRVLSSEKILGDACFVLLPYPIESIGNKEDAQKFVDEAQKKLDKMEE